MKSTMLALILAIAVAAEIKGQIAISRQSQATARAVPNYEPSSNYRNIKLRGYRIRVNKLLVRGHSELYKRAIEVMDYQLFKIERVLPTAAVEKLQKL